MSVILGIDPGCETTGYGFIHSDGRQHALIAYGVIRTQRRADFSMRLRHIYEKLIDLIRNVKPDMVALEDVFYAVNVKSALRLGHARGVILLAAAQADLPVHAYSPLEIKNSVVGYGRADKQQVQKMVQVILSIRETPSPSDASDALAIALCHAFHMNHYGQIKGQDQPGRRRS
ncbi:MAG: crossover junction endodeoxyribonuclease RuvC [Acidobacteria bacterium]|nr:crossover junction endodeoxyribonuclease RuvC [Acidobacteriota bacterium]